MARIPHAMLPRSSAPLRHAVAPARRTFATSRSARVQRLLWAGAVLDRTSAALAEVPRDWLLSLGAQSDVEQGISFTSLAASPSHALLAYRTLPSSSAPTHDSSAPALGEYAATRVPHARHRVVAVGRNTHGELGLGYTSHEATWGLVSPGFDGEGGVRAVHAGGSSSWIVTKTHAAELAPNSLFAFGNHTSGQLALGQHVTQSASGEPQLALVSAPRRASLQATDERLQHAGEEAAAPTRVLSLATGLDHSLALLDIDGRQEVRSTGVNTDGQLGRPDVRFSSPALLPLAPFWGGDTLRGVAAGGDTSVAWSAARIWGWGNSEYGQALSGELVDRIEAPREYTHAVDAALQGARVADVKCGGSWTLVLDDQGRVFSCGFGALGLGAERLSSATLQQIPALAHERIVTLGAGLEYCAALSASGRLYSWGLNSPSGRLGLGPPLPRPSFALASRFTPDAVELRTYEPLEAQGMRRAWSRVPQHAHIVCGRDALWVLVEDGQEEVGRWAAR